MSYEVKSDSVVLRHGDNTVEVALKGATVISFKTSGTERLFVSTKSNVGLSDKAAIRGGVPVCWPVFGPPPSEAPYDKLKQHGFARTSQWTFDSSTSGPDPSGSGAAQAVFTLASSSITRAVFDKDFRLVYTVRITKSSELDLRLQVQAPSEGDDLRFQALLHTYLLLPESVQPDQVQVQPLQGLKFIDKVAGGREGKEDRSVVVVQGPNQEVDRVYHRAPNELRITYQGSKGSVTVSKNGLADVVLWNPGAEKAATIGDMQEGGASKYVCLEPGQVSSWVELSKGEKWEGSVVMKWDGN
ncbi:BZ3500_MvSof-1268-A1-R1_Chr1-3g02260 [Microbotryum saponariae]|uniref:Glucose-6-phosphate 1-epimerase n=1 Tax=Microbotryum saponariae TaxID=289078 RepID=A0A2X0KEH1_9BASI|nr:BZ3500_MvSof-1268-A1-R1_Chr1-3g02260 [Microbotryum saponariae]SCZ95806.1 BZ3501_MvSof-1269-A2-R1_Chr1-3g01863 [Microbotryum saponariae]